MKTREEAKQHALDVASKILTLNVLLEFTAGALVIYEIHDFGYR